MEPADLQQRAESAVRKVRAVRERLRKNPGIELLVAVAAGFIAGLLLRAFEKSDEPR